MSACPSDPTRSSGFRSGRTSSRSRAEELLEFWFIGTHVSPSPPTGTFSCLYVLVGHLRERPRGSATTAATWDRSSGSVKCYWRRAALPRRSRVRGGPQRSVRRRCRRITGFSQARALCSGRCSPIRGATKRPSAPSAPHTTPSLFRRRRQRSARSAGHVSASPGSTRRGVGRSRPGGTAGRSSGNADEMP